MKRTRKARGMMLALAAASAIAGTGPLHAAVVFWDGGTSGNWSDTSQWSTTATGTGGPVTAQGKDIVFYVTGPNNTINAAVDVNSTASSLTFGNNQTSHAVNVNGPATLTLTGSSNYIPSNFTSGANTNLGTVGIYYQSGFNSATIAATLLLGGSQLWQNDNTTHALAVSGNINLGSYILTTGGAGAFNLSGNLSGAGSLTLNGAGIVTLSGTNTYTGDTAINQGTASVNRIATGTSNFGTSANAISLGDATHNGIISYTGTSATYTRGLTIAAGGGEFDVVNTGNTVTMTTNGVVTSGQFTVGGAGVTSITAAITGSGSLFKDDAGTLILSGANSYAGNTTVNLGVMRMAAANVIPNGAGKGDVTATGTFDLNTFSQGINGLSGAGTVDTIAGGTPTLTVGNNDATSTFTGVLKNSAGTLAVTKTGVGTLTLGGGADTFTGATNVNQGMLNLTGGSMGGTALNVASNATLGVRANYTQGSGAAGTVTVASGGVLDMTSGAANTMTLSNTGAATSVLTLGSGGASILNMDVGATADRITISTGRINIGTGYATINLTNLGGLSGTTQTLISAAGGVNGQTFAQFAAGATLNTTGNYGGIVVALGSTTTSLTLTETANATPTNAYWKGGIDANWNTFTGGNANNTNWATDATGATDTHQGPGTTTNVFFATNTASNLTTTLAQNYSINSLTFTGVGSAAANSVSINGNTLSISTGGMTVNAGSGAHTINSALVLNGAQTWQNNSANLLTINGNVTNGGNLLTLGGSGNIAMAGVIGSGSGGVTVSGTGTVTLSNTNTYTGPTTLTSGVLVASANQAMGTTASGLQLNGGSLDLATPGVITAYNVSVGGSGATILADRSTIGAGGTQTLGTLAIGAQTLNVAIGGNINNAAAALAFGTTTLSGNATVDTAAGTSLTLGALVGNSNLTKQDSGQLILGTTSTRNGGSVTLAAGTIVAATNSPFGTTGAALVLNGGTLDLAVSTSITAYNTTIGGAATILSDRATAGAGVNHTLGSLSIGSQILTLGAGANVTSGTAGIAFNGNTTLTGGATINTNTGVATTLNTVSGAAQNLSIGGVGNTTIVGAISTTTGSLFKTGASTLTLAGNSAFTGSVNILQGVVNAASIGANANLGGGTTSVLLGDASNTGTLAYTGSSVSEAHPMTVNAGGGEFDVTTSGQTVSLTAGITDNGLLTLGGAGNLTDSSAISGAGSVVKTGAGILSLTGASTFSGGLALKVGTVKFGNAAALGTGTFNIGDTTGSTAVTIDASAAGLTINNAQNWNQDFTFSGSNNATFGTGAVTLAGSRQVTVNTNTLTLNNIIGESVVGSGLTKAGNGTLDLTGANNYSGPTILSAGNLIVANSQALGTGTALQQAAGSTLTLQIDAGINAAYNLSLTGTGIATVVADRATSGATVSHTLGNLTIGSETLALTKGTGATSSAALTFGNTSLSGNPVFDTAASTTLSLGSLSGNVNFTKQGAGQLSLIASSARSSGAAVVTAGTVFLKDQAALGTVGATLSIGGATLDLATDNTVNAYNTTLNGTTTIAVDRATSGALANQTLGTLVTNGNQLNVTVGANVTGSANLTFGATTLGAGTTFDTAANTNLTLGALSGNVAWDKQDSGQLTLNTASSRTSGAFTLNAGTVQIGNISALGTTGATITLASGILDLATDATVNAYPVTVSGNATILSDKANAASPGITQTLGALSLSNKILTIDQGANVSGGAPAVAFGAVTLSSTSGTISTATGVSTTMTTVSATIAALSITGAGNATISGAYTQSFTSQLFKSGTGTLTLGGANSYSGATSVTGGVLNIQNASALGTTATGTTLANGTTLQIQNNINVGAEALSLVGTGASGQNGALVNVSGNNTFGGVMTLTGATTISSDAGTLALTGNMTGGTFAVTLTGSGVGSISGNISTTSGTVAKNGTGTWTLSGTNSYTGSTSVNNGILVAANNSALGTAANGTVVASGATLQLAGGINIASEALQINGSGYTGQHGALSNLSGNNTFGGAISLGSGAAISSDAGSLTLTNAITGTGLDLTLRGAGNGSVVGVNTGAAVLFKADAGTWMLTGASNFTGTTDITGGTLKLGAAATLVSPKLYAGAGATFDVSSVTGGFKLASGQTLTGFGNVLGATTALSGGIVNPGDVGPIGTLSTGNMTFNAGSHLAIDLNGATADQLAVTGTTALGGSLDVSIGGAPSAGSYTVLTSSGTLSSAFSNVAFGNRVISSDKSKTFQVTQSGNNVVLSNFLSPATIAIAAQAASTNVHVGSNTVGVYVGNTSIAGSDSLNYTLTGNVTGSFTRAAGDANAAAGDLRTGAYNAVAGVNNLSVTASDPNAVNAPQSTTFTVTGYNLAAANTVAAVNLGNVHVGDTFGNASLNIQNTAANAGFSEKLDASFGSVSGAAVNNGGAISLLGPQANDNTSMVVGVGNGVQSTAGAVTGSAVVNLTSNGSGTSGLGTTALTAQTVNITGNVYRLAAANDLTTPTINLGNVHVGGTFGTSSLSVQNTAANDGFSEKLDAAFGSTTGAASGTGAISLLGPFATDASSMAVGLGNAAQNTSGTINGTIAVNLVSDGTATSGLGNTSLGGQSVSVTGFVYTGQGIWNTNGNGNWSDFSAWQSGGGTPGVDGALSANDTATFGDALTGGASTVTLNGPSVRLAGLTFNSLGSYTIARSGSQTLTLDNGANPVPVSVIGNHTIAVPVILGSEAVITTVGSNDSLTMSGNISGPHGISKEGAGVLNLNGTNTYTGNTVVNSGTLNVNGSLAGGVVVNAATLGGTGIINGNTELKSGSLFSPNTAGTTGVIQLSSLTLDDGSTVQVDLTSISAYDQIQLTSIAKAGGANTTLDVIDLLGGTVPFHVNDSFQIFSTGVGNAFTNVILPDGYTWDTSSLATEGKISVLTVSVPEPGAFMLGLLGLIPAALWLKKSRRGKTIEAVA